MSSKIVTTYESIVRFYIDGKLDGEKQLWKSKTGVSGFYYTPKQKLSLGKHVLQVTGFKDGKESLPSSEIVFITEEDQPAPTVIAPYYYKDDVTTYVLRGLVKSGDMVDVYVDGRKIKTIQTLESTTGVSGFRVVVSKLKDGNHSAYFVALDKNTGKRSRRWNNNSCCSSRRVAEKCRSIA